MAESDAKFPRNKKLREDAAVQNRRECRLMFAECVSEVDFLQMGAG